MALTNSGFDGTVTEAAWANMSAMTDVDVVESGAAWAVTQGTGRQVSTAAHSGYAFAKGVLSKDTAAILTALATPVDGQWFLICRHIDWSTNGVTVIAVAHSTTTTTVPTVAPTTYPTIDNNPGVLYDQKLGWAWVNSVDTTVTLFDLRRLPPSVTDLQSFGWVNAAARTAQTGMRAGDTGYQADTDTQYRWSGAAWKLVSVPFAMAAGIAQPVSTTADTVVTFPAGRFTVPPVVVLGPAWVSASGALGGGAVVAYNTSATQFSVRALGVTGVIVNWVAVQMTSTTAGG